jgi:bifunctional enzyme CysN/CysC
MDLVDYDQAVFERIQDEFTSFASKLAINDLTFIPISALDGDNVVDRSMNMPWYEGTSLLHHLEHVHIASDRNLTDVRLPVQWVIRPMSHDHHDYRGYAGSVAGGVFKPGDEVVVLPSGFASRIRSIDTFDGPVAEAFSPMAVTMTLEDEIDISRGDMICRPQNQPQATQDVDAMVCWLTELSSLRTGSKLTIKQTTRTAKVLVKDMQYRLDINTLHREEGVDTLTLNEIGRVQLRTQLPLFCDEYRRNRTTGSFILIDDATHNTVAAGMIVGTSTS